jgi:hypothetical protein
MLRPTVNLKAPTLTGVVRVRVPEPIVISPELVRLVALSA